MSVDVNPYATGGRMQRPRDLLAHTAIALATALAAGCSDSSAPALVPPAGVLEVTISTTGPTANIDPDGYFISLDGLGLRTINVNAVMTFEALVNGVHHVELNGLAAQCRLDGPNRRAVDINAQTGAGSRVSVLFSVTCAPEEPGSYPWDY